MTTVKIIMWEIQNSILSFVFIVPIHVMLFIMHVWRKNMLSVSAMFVYETLIKKCVEGGCYSDLIIK